MFRLLVLTLTIFIFVSCSTSKEKGSTQAQNFKQGTDKYFKNYAYVNEARSLGNAGFAAIEAGDGNKAKALLTDSTLKLAQGANGHTQYINGKIKKRQTTNTIVSTGLMIGLAVLGVTEGRNKSQTEVNQLNQSISEVNNSISNIKRRVDANILQQEQSNLHANARNVDIGMWRTAVISSHPIAKSVVLVNSLSSSRSCTGFFIQPRVVATAAHCLDDSKTRVVQRQIPESGEAFMTDQTQNFSVVRKYYHPNWNDSNQSRNRPRKEYVSDVGLLIVDRPSQHWLKLDLSKRSVGDELMIMGYSSDLNDGYFLRLDYGCEVQSAAYGNRIYISDCAAYPGNSGGPVLSLKHGEPRVGSITSFGPSNKSSGVRRDGNNGSVSINVLASLYKEAIINHPKAGDINLFN